MADHDLRLRILNWVQDHHIQRYTDQSVLSHNESVEQLLDVFFEEPGITNFSTTCAADRHQHCDGRDSRGARCHCKCHSEETEQSRFLKVMSRMNDGPPMTHRYFSSAIEARQYFSEDVLPEEELQRYWMHATDEHALYTITGFFFPVLELGALFARALDDDEDDFEMDLDDPDHDGIED